MVDDQAKQNPATDKNGYPARPIPKNDDKCEYYNKTQLLQLLERVTPWALRIFLQTWHPLTFGFFLCSVVGSDLQVTAMRIGDIWETDESGDHVEPLVVVDKGAYYGEAPDLVPYSDKGEPRRAKVEADGFWACGVLESYNRSNGAERTNPSLSEPGVVALIQFMMLLGNKRLLYCYEKPGPSSPEERHLAALLHALNVVTYNRRAVSVIKYTPRPPLLPSNSANTQAGSLLPAQETPAQQSAQQQQTLPPSQTTQYRHILPSTGARPCPPFYPPLPAAPYGAPYGAPYPAQYPAAMNPQIPSQSAFCYSTVFHQEELQYPQGIPYPHAPAQPYIPVPPYPYPQAQSRRNRKDQAYSHSRAPMPPYAQTNPFPQALLDPRLTDGSSGLTHPDGRSLPAFDPTSAGVNSSSISNAVFHTSNNDTPNAAGALPYGSAFPGTSGWTSINPPHPNGSFVTLPDAGSQSGSSAFGFSAEGGSFPAGDEALGTPLALPHPLADADVLATGSVAAASMAGDAMELELGQGSEPMEGAEEGAEEGIGVQRGSVGSGVGAAEEVLGDGSRAAKRVRVG